MTATRPLLAALAAFSLAAALATPSRAQAPVPGSRLRVTAPELGLDRRVGTLVEVRGDTLFAAFDRDTLAVPLAGAARVEASRGFRRHPVRRAVVGALAGGAVALASVALTAETVRSNGEGVALVELFVVSPVVIVGGAALGAVTAPRQEAWHPLAPTGTALRPGASIRLRATAGFAEHEAARVEAVRGGSVVLRRRDGSLVALPVDSVAGMEARLYTGSREEGAWRGARRGFVAGALLGALGGSMVFPGDPAYERPTLVAQGAMLGAGLLTVAGAVAGAVHPGRPWSPVVPARVGVAPTRAGGTRVAVSLRL